ncbi:uncharacterized protein LOC143468831 [Clavelina lepadiformis]|uniref:uncharacterized protein LOC143468831 n=1 Tax=Clavelina lepadiformis TaxID=159417 RepID=UPI004041CC02
MACLGCLSPQRTATEVVDAIAIGVRPEVEKQTGEKYTRYFAVSFRSQVVAGIMYYIKIDVGDGNYIIIRVWWNVEQRFLLEGVKTNVKESDPIEPFDSNNFLQDGDSTFLPATERIQEIANIVKPEVEKRTHEIFNKFVAVSYREQLVAVLRVFDAMILFHIKVDVGDGRHILTTVLKTFQNNYVLEDVQKI